MLSVFLPGMSLFMTIKTKIIFALYYITLFTWFNDENESLEKTMSALDKYLNTIEKVIKFLWTLTIL